MTNNFEDRPDWIKDLEVGTDKLEYNGKTYQYSIVQADETEKEVPGFLGMYDEKFLYISHTTPELYIYPQLVHEIIEFTELKGIKHACPKSTERELQFVPEPLLPAYIEYRKKLFTNLVKYYKKREGPRPGFKEELQLSLNKFTKLSEKN